MDWTVAESQGDCLHLWLQETKKSYDFENHVQILLTQH